MSHWLLFKRNVFVETACDNLINKFALVFISSSSLRIIVFVRQTGGRQVSDGIFLSRKSSAPYATKDLFLYFGAGESAADLINCIPAVLFMYTDKRPYLLRSIFISRPADLTAGNCRNDLHISSGGNMMSIYKSMANAYIHTYITPLRNMPKESNDTPSEIYSRLRFDCETRFLQRNRTPLKRSQNSWTIAGSCESSVLFSNQLWK